MHTHGDLLASSLGVSEEKAIRQFVDDLLNNKQIVAVMKKENKVEQAWITYDPIEELKYQQEDEVLEFRYWTGQKLNFEN